MVKLVERENLKKTEERKGKGQRAEYRGEGGGGKDEKREKRGERKRRKG